MHVRGFSNAFHNRDMSDDEVFDYWMEDVNDSPIDALPDQSVVKELLKKCHGLISMIINAPPSSPLSSICSEQS